MFNAFKQLQSCFGGVNPDGTVGCGWKDLQPFFLGLQKNLILVGMFVAAFTVAYAGFVLLKGQGDPASRSAARNIFMNVIVGLIILFGAYFIVSQIITKLLVEKIYTQGVI